MSRSAAIEELTHSAVPMDQTTVAFYLRIPRSHVVLLQAYFELYDGVGAVTTLAGDEPVVCVLTPVSQQDDCMRVLEALRGEIHWQTTSKPDNEMNLRLKE